MFGHDSGISCETTVGYTREGHLHYSLKECDAGTPIGNLGTRRLYVRRRKVTAVTRCAPMVELVNGIQGRPLGARHFFPCSKQIPDVYSRSKDCARIRQRSRRLEAITSRDEDASAATFVQD